MINLKQAKSPPASIINNNHQQKQQNQAASRLSTTNCNQPNIIKCNETSDANNKLATMSARTSTTTISRAPAKASLTTSKIQQCQQKFLAAAAKSATSLKSPATNAESAWRTPLLPSPAARSTAINANHGANQDGGHTNACHGPQLPPCHPPAKFEDARNNQHQLSKQFSAPDQKHQKLVCEDQIAKSTIAHDTPATTTTGNNSDHRQQPSDNNVDIWQGQQTPSMQEQASPSTSAPAKSARSNPMMLMMMKASMMSVVDGGEVKLRNSAVVVAESGDASPSSVAAASATVASPVVATTTASTPLPSTDVGSSGRGASEDSAGEINREAAAARGEQQHEVRRAGERDGQVRKKNRDQEDVQVDCCNSVGQAPQTVIPINTNIDLSPSKNNNNHLHNQHYHHHHYLQQSHQHQQYQPHQNHQHHRQQMQPQQHVMAHYKFHNDCQSSVLTYEQVKRLDFVMDQIVPIHGKGNVPTLYVKLKELIRLVKHKLQKEHSIEIRDVRLNGGASLYVLAPENSHYNDLDLIFGTDLSDGDRFDVIRDVVLECLMEFYPKDQAEDIIARESSHGGDMSKSSGTEEKNITGDDDSKSEVSKSNRSSSFESDNLNITANEESSDSNSEESDSQQEDRETVEISHSDCDVDDNKNNSKVMKRQVSDDISGSISQKGISEGCGLGSTLQGRQAAKHSTINEVTRGNGTDIGLITKSVTIQRPAPLSLQNIYHQMPLNNCAIKEAYVHKMVKVNDDDRWSLISLGVQQSEANCQQQSAMNGGLPSTVIASVQEVEKQRRNVTDGPRQFGTVTRTDGVMHSDQQYYFMLPTFNDGCNEQNYQQHVGAATHTCQQYHYQKQQKQFPNSIELKFVDRMRRKFEFSVDSFQIILDSLIQFYDYAPQSTITISKKLAGSCPSSTTINTRPLTSMRRCSACCTRQRAFEDDEPYCSYQRDYHVYSSELQSVTKFIGSRQHREQVILNGSRSYYQLPLDSAPIDSSVASSSGCSSSSSVVSSSSSLSCDEDHEDLCDVDSSPSSSASTSSLLSSTTLSMLSSNGSQCVQAKMKFQKQQQQDPQQSRLSYVSDEYKNNQENGRSPSSLMVCKLSRTPQVESKEKLRTTSTTTVSSSPSKIVLNDCAYCFNQHKLNCNSKYQQSNLVNKSVCDLEAHKTSCAVISENFYPTVIGRSEYGNFKEALYHLEKKLIATRSPEEIRGGGLLKYCNLLVKNYKPTNVYQIRTLERYMCSRFFIDFSDPNQQRAKLESYLANHFSDDPIQKFDYLTILHNVVQRSTVCLMNHELRLTLNMIRELAYKLNEQQLKQHPAQSQIQQSTSHPQTNQQQPVTCRAQSSDQQQQQICYRQQRPVVMQSGVYRVKLVNYSLAKSFRS